LVIEAAVLPDDNSDMEG